MLEANGNVVKYIRGLGSIKVTLLYGLKSKSKKKVR